MNSLYKGRLIALLASLATAGVLAGEPSPPPPPAPVSPAVTVTPPAQSAQAQAQTERKLAEAQQRLEAAAREVSELSAQLGTHMRDQRYFMRGMEPNVMIHSAQAAFMPMRAQLGVQIDKTPSKDGAHVVAVSPGGPAAEAGIRNGDVIVSVAGEDLTKYGNPAQTLVERTHELQPDLKVKVSVLRAGKKMDFDVTPRPIAPWPASWRSRARSGPAHLHLADPSGQPGFRMARNGRHGSGHDRSWHAFSRHGVRDDVGAAGRLLRRQGRRTGRSHWRQRHVQAAGRRCHPLDRWPRAGNAQHAGRILRSYRGGEKLTLRCSVTARPRTSRSRSPALPPTTTRSTTAVTCAARAPRRLPLRASPRADRAGAFACAVGQPAAVRRWSDRRTAGPAFVDLPSLLRPDDLLVFNDTRVVAARLYGTKPSGGRVEVFLERAIGTNRALAQLRASKPIREGLIVTTDGGRFRWSAGVTISGRSRRPPRCSRFSRRTARCRCRPT